MKPIKTGLCAYGLSGQVFHAPFIRLHDGFELTAVVERSIKRVQQKYPDTRSLDSFEQLLNAKDIELIVVNTPDITHYDLCKRALEAGKHVLVEKPFVFSSSEAEELIRISQDMRLSLTVYQNRRYDGDFLTVQEIVQSGKLGRIVEFQSAFQRYRPELSPIAWKENGDRRVGITYNLCSHLCDQAVVLFGKPQAVWATLGSQRDGSKIDDYSYIQLIYRDIKVSLRAGMLIREPAARFAVHGTKGSYVKFGLDPQEERLRHGGMKPTLGDWGCEPESEWGILNTDDGRKPYPTVCGNYYTFYDQLYRAIRENQPAPVSIPDMLTDVKILNAAFESYEKGCIISI